MRHPAGLGALAAFASALILPSIGRASTPGSGSSQPGQVVFLDAFNGPAWTMPDPTKWSPIEADGGFGNNELQIYTKSPENISLDGFGHLRINAVRKRDHAGGFYYTSGKLVSLSYPFFYGHAEARIKVPGGEGLWPAFWMLGVGDGPLSAFSGVLGPFGDLARVNPLAPLGWPNSGEIDVMEAIGRMPHTVFGSIHGPVKKLTGQTKPSTHTGTLNLKKPVSAGYHIYAVDSSPGMLKFSVDGIVYKVLKRSDMEPNEQWVYDRPFKLILNLAVGGTFGGDPTSRTQFPAQMLVDYVKITSTHQRSDHRRD